MKSAVARGWATREPHRVLGRRGRRRVLDFTAEPSPADIEPSLRGPFISLPARVGGPWGDHPARRWASGDLSSFVNYRGSFESGLGTVLAHAYVGMPGGSRSHCPHDSLVRYVFSRPEAVAIVLRRLLPAELIRHIDFASLQALPTVDSDATLRTRAGDLRFEVDVVDGDRRMPLLLVLEHQSTLDLRLPFRAHAYVGDVWSRFIQDHPDATEIPVVVPILLAQHPARLTPSRLSDGLDVTPRILRLLGDPVRLELLVDDLSGSVLGDTHAEPVTRALVEVTRALLHAYRNPGAITPSRAAVLAEQFDVLLQPNNPLGERDVGALWRYVLTVFGAQSPLHDLIVDAVGRRAKEMYTTIADDLRAEGRAAGLSEGRAAGLSEGRAAGLSEGRVLGRAEALIEVLGHRGMTVSDDVRARVLSTRDRGRIERLFARALVVDSVEALFESERSLT